MTVKNYYSEETVNILKEISKIKCEFLGISRNEKKKNLKKLEVKLNNSIFKDKINYVLKNPIVWILSFISTAMLVYILVISINEMNFIKSIDSDPHISSGVSTKVKEYYYNNR